MGIQDRQPISKNEFEVLWALDPRPLIECALEHGGPMGFPDRWMKYPTERDRYTDFGIRNFDRLMENLDLTLPAVRTHFGDRLRLMGFVGD